MMRALTIWAGMLLVGLFASPLVQGAEPAAKGSPQLDFDRDIRPILAEHCIGCHGGDKPQGGFQLTSREAALKPTESGQPAIVPHQPNDSLMLRRLTAEGDERMPPAEKEPLKPAEIANLRQWVAAGAKWSQHWAFLPLKNAQPPKLDSAGRNDTVRNDIDRFIRVPLLTKKLSPAPVADRYTLIKRLSYDLLGLPPSIAEVDSFVHDDHPQAYERLVDRLLASPHFGERWGRHWLDLARYADSDGYEKDRGRPDAYLYRDWVIEAINADLPFDQFTIQQLAGDLLDTSTPRDRLATAFNRQTLTNEEGGVDQEEFRIAAVFDRTETVGAAFLGLTVGCCRCHAHKYDPLPHTDYYRLFAFFNNADEVVAPLALKSKNQAALQAELRPLDRALQQRLRELAPAENAWNIDEHRQIKATPDDKLAERPVTLVDVRTPGEAQVKADTATITLPAEIEKATYTITLTSDQELTGLKLYALADETLPQKGPGLSIDGNFIVTGVQAYVVEPGQSDRPVKLHRPVADFAATKYSIEKLLSPAATGTAGWSIFSKSGETHSLQLRTCEPLKLTAAQRIKLVIEQQAGNRNLLGKLRIAGLIGGRRGLRYPVEIATHLEMYPEKRVYLTKERLFNYYVNDLIQDPQVLKLRDQIAAVQKRHQAQLSQVRMIAEARLPRETNVFHRGDFLTPAESVSPGVPIVLGNVKPRGKQADRLDLARWLVSPTQSQTPRVVVNQVWQHLFGEGLVPSMTDFGVRGEPPTNPELLDWLARTFRDDLGWSRKGLIRLIVTSHTYRQSSAHRDDIREIDPHNHLLARQNRFRVEGEIVRDLTLAVSGLLSDKIGGPSVFPPMPADLAKLSYANNFTWGDSSGEDRYRRGMYTFFKRTIPHPNLTTFDCPDANIACALRTVSNTPLQALTLLNNESHVETAQALAKRLWVEQPPFDSPAASADRASVDRARLSHALRLCIARSPSATELSALERVLDGARRYYPQHVDEAKLIVGAQQPAGVEPVEAAAWVVAARVIINLDEFITRE